MRTLILALLIFIAVDAHAQYPGITCYNVGPISMACGPEKLTEYNGKLYYYANDNVHGGELWELDPATGMVSMVADINPGSNGSNRADVTVLYNWETYMVVAPFHDGPGTVLYFFADDGVSGTELWKYNGIAAPKLVKETKTGTAGLQYPSTIVFLNDKLYFFDHNGSMEFWQYDVYSAAMKKLNVPTTISSFSNESDIIAFNGKIYFTALGAGTGWEVWQYDPVTDAFSVAFDIRLGSGSSNPGDYKVINNKLYFSVSYQDSLFEFDGVSPLKGIALAYQSSGRSSITEYNQKIYFSGRDAVFGRGHFAEYDPATKKVKKIAVLNHKTGTSGQHSFTEYLGKLYFSGQDSTNTESLWEYDGISTPKLITKLAGTTGGQIFIYLHAMNNGVYFIAGQASPSGPEVYKYDPQWAAVEGVSVKKEISIYPNPTTKTIHINAPANIDKLVITDVMGRVVFGPRVPPAFGGTGSKTPGGTKTATADIDVPGIYFITVTTVAGVKTEKVVVNP
jgi:ELWxxDGT repeat protein